MTNEEILLRALNGESLAEGATFQPQNNTQAYLAYLVGLITDLTVLPSPRTNEEALLYKACVDGIGGNKVEIHDASYLFYNGTRLDSVDSLISSCVGITSAIEMFHDCDKMEQVDLSKLDTSNVTSMDSMFLNCSSLVNLDISNFNTSKVTSIRDMFSNCSSLKNIDLSNFDTSNVTDMGNLFSSCASLENIVLGSFNTRNVTNMGGMFSYCQSLTNIDLSALDTSNVTNMGTMFYYCSSIKTINVGNFNTDKVTLMSNMFSGCSNLDEIIGFSATNKAGLTIGFPKGKETERYALKRLTFRTDLPSGKYAIRSKIDVQYCSFERSGMVEMFNTLTNVSSLGLSSDYRTITITGNPCVTGKLPNGTACETLTNEDKAIATSKGWTLVT